MDKSSDIQWYVLVAYRCESLAAAGATCKSALNMISVKLARALEPDSITFLALHPRPTPTSMSGRGELFELVPILVDDSVEKS